MTVDGYSLVINGLPINLQWFNNVLTMVNNGMIWEFTLWVWLTVRHGFSMAPVEIDGLPINSMVIFHGYVK